MKFKTVFKKGKKILVKIALDDGNEVWATTTQAVYNWCEKSFNEDDEVDVEYTSKNGQYFVKRISTPGKGGSKKTSSPKETTSDSEYACEDCGASLKDGKYKKCYKCNKKNPSKSSGGGSGKPDYKNGAPYGSLLPEEATRRNKLATLSSVCKAYQVMAGQVSDVETVGEQIIVIWKKVYKELFG